MSLAKKTISGIKWISIARLSKQLFQFVTILILAKLLSPVDFGLMGMAMVVIGFLNIFNDLGVSAAIIHKQNIDERLLSSVFWLNISFGILVMVGLAVSAPFIAMIYGDSRLVPILQLLSISFFVASVTFLQQTYFEKKLLFKFTARAEIISVFISSIAAIGLAYKGYGVWALVFQTLLGASVNSFALWVSSPWRPKFTFHWADVRSLMNFSLNLSGFNIFNYLIRSADSILIGKYLGATALGYYSLALRIILYPLQNITAVISKVMYPVYSSINQNDAKIREIYTQISCAIAFLTFPMMLGIMAIGDMFVYSFLGNKWEPIINLLYVLAPVGLLQSLDSTTGTLFQIKGKTNWLFWWGMLTGVLFLFAYIIGLKWGIIGVAGGYLILTLVQTYPGFAIPFRLINLKVKNYFFAVKGILLASLVMGLLVFVSKNFFAAYTSVKINFFLNSFFGLVLYIIGLFLVDRKTLSDFFKIYKQVNT